jgi:putative ABC transport system permease protein
MWKYVCRNFLRNKRRSALTVLSIAVSIFLLVTMATVFEMLAATPSEHSQFRVVARHKISLMMDLPQAHRAKIEAVPEVESVCALTWFGGVYIEPKNFFAQFAVDPETLRDVFPENKFDEAEWEAFASERTAMAAGRKLAEKFGWKTGDAVHIKGDIYPFNLELRLRAIFENVAGENQMYFHQKYFDELAQAKGLPAMVGTYWMKLRSPDDVLAVSRKVDAMFANSEKPTKTDTEKAFQMEFLSMMGNVKALFRNTGLAVTFAILMVAANTMAMTFRERTSEIAVLKTIGFLRGRILFMVLAESLMIAALGGLLGTGGALALYAKVNPAPDFFPIFYVPAWAAAMGFGIALVVGVLGGGLPALQAARLDVVTGLRKTV